MLLLLSVLLVVSVNGLYNDISKLDVRILNGQKATIGQFPFMVSIQIPSCFIPHNCGGSIIHENWVLTAAHCLDEISFCKYIIRAGIISIFDKGQCRYIKSYHIHDNYRSNDDSAENDIALLEVHQPFKFSDSVGLIAIGSIGFDDYAQIAGWGRGSYKLLHWGKMKTQSESEKFCGDGDPDKQVCCLVNNTSAYYGDSGGPLVNEKGELVGITSYGGIFQDQRTNVFTRVEAYLEWINTTINGVKEY